MRKLSNTFKVLAVGAFVLSSCSNQEPDLLTVRHFHLQDVDPVDDKSEMARGDQLYRLRGAVTMEERKARLGHYYTVSWQNDQVGGGDLEVVMDYQQAATASKIIRMSRTVPGEEESGRVEFKIAGEDYRVGGRVLAWRVQLRRGAKVLAEEHSYLWKDQADSGRQEG
ncbi:hypothetical protein HW115_10315 [Verrucomicrobiaceae bacterium N1E253]|uniref:Lipoprotein n=1 Tax=Oceaniferula marina TaxID=2748318 RepID=A0A851GLR1_9BACT|nr:hypothetical protein [Oceaniferula marina]NWK56007.1 hypothetical protein [Oceaniferula marina]